MAKLRDYNMNGTIILGVDAGYGNYKTARCCFPTSVSRSSQPPVFTRDYLEYEGSYYTIGEGHKDFVAEKSLDDDNYILTLAAIAKELKARGLSAAKIHLAVGLPLKWVQAQRDSFREYMMQNRHVDYKYAGKRYTVDIADCTVMPQCYAAVAESLPDFKGMHMIADIGNGTMNVMILNNGKASESKSWTVRLGAMNVLWRSAISFWTGKRRNFRRRSLRIICAMVIQKWVEDTSSLWRKRQSLMWKKYLRN